MAKARGRDGGGGGAFVAGLILGAVAGAAATLWLTPVSGPELRATLRRRAEEVRHQLQQRGSDLGARSREMVAARRPVTSLGATPEGTVSGTLLTDTGAPAATEPAAPEADGVVGETIVPADQMDED